MKTRNRRTAILWGLGIGLALASVAGFSGGVVPWMDGFSHLHMQYGIAGAVFTLAAILLKARRLPLFVAALMVINFIPVAPHMSFSPVEAATPGLKVVTMNLWVRNHRTGETLDFLRRQDADILLLQETAPHWLKALESLKDIYPHQISQTDCPAMRSCEVMLMSKKPWSEAKAGLIEDTGAALVWARFPEAGLTVATTHLNRPFWTRGVPQTRQIEALARHIQSVDGPFLIAGDFNATPWSAAYARLIETAGLRRAGHGLNVSWPSWLWPLAGIPIDHVLVKGRAGAIAVQTGEGPGSDHRALIALIGARAGFPGS